MISALPPGLWSLTPFASCFLRASAISFAETRPLRKSSTPAYATHHLSVPFDGYWFVITVGTPLVPSARRDATPALLSTGHQTYASGVVADASCWRTWLSCSVWSNLFSMILIE